MTYTDQSNMLPETGFLRLPQVLKIVPVGKSTWWAGVKSGRYPKGQKLSPRTTAWKVEDIRALIAELSNEGGKA
jgi:prophage regulatory protein